jgi:hypothetical protein
MGFRAILLMVVLVLAGLGCTSPGKGYAYLDVLIQPFATSSVFQPSTSQIFTLTFPVRNTYDQPVTVGYDIHQNVTADPIDPLSGPVVQNGSVEVPAFGTVNVTLSLPVQTAGPHSWSIALDPTGVLAEQNETNNTATRTLAVADYDVSFGLPSPAVTVSLTPASPLTIDFAITNTNNVAAALATTANVNVAITVDSGTAVTPLTISAGAPLAAATLPIAVAAGATVPVRMTVPWPGTGSHVYTIVLTPVVADSNVPNNTTVVTVPVAN